LDQILQITHKMKNPSQHRTVTQFTIVTKCSKLIAMQMFDNPAEEITPGMNGHF